MIDPGKTVNEQERLHDLQELSILDTLPEEEYDSVTRLASQICNTPISLVTLVDEKRQWFKSKHGITATETPREIAFCAHAIKQPTELLEVPDSRADERFADNPLVTDDPQVIFYAGIPLVSSKGNALGTLCVIDNKPGKLTTDQRNALKALSNHVVKLFELRRKALELEALKEKLEQRNEQLKQFASVAAHDLKSPLNNITTTVDMMRQLMGDKLGEEGTDLAAILEESSVHLRELVDGLLQHSIGDSLLQEEWGYTQLQELFDDIEQIFEGKDTPFKVEYNPAVASLYVNAKALRQVFVNIISHCAPLESGDTNIVLGFVEGSKEYLFTVQATWANASVNISEKRLQPFKQLNVKGSHQLHKDLVGLSVAQKLVTGMGGSIAAQPTQSGIEIQFTISH